MSRKRTLSRLERLAAAKGYRPPVADPFADNGWWDGVTDEQLDRAIAELRNGQEVSDPAVKRALDQGRAAMAAWIAENKLDEDGLDQVIRNLEALLAADDRQAEIERQVDEALSRLASAADLKATVGELTAETGAFLDDPSVVQEARAALLKGALPDVDHRRRAEVEATLAGLARKWFPGA